MLTFQGAKFHHPQSLTAFYLLVLAKNFPENKDCAH